MNWLCDQKWWTDYVTKSVDLISWEKILDFSENSENVENSDIWENSEKVENSDTRKNSENVEKSYTKEYSENVEISDNRENFD